MVFPNPIRAPLPFLFALLCLLQPFAQATRWITYTGSDGTVYLNDNRRPSLYTGNYGDCLGNSLINVTRFDAAWYKDNMTVLFHLAGETALTNVSLMMYIGVFAYGESRFDLTFNPCNANIESLCPANASVPIEASGIIPVSNEDVSSVPTIALTIPDFEGEAVLRIFSNETESEIGCYSAVLTNGHTFSHPAAVGSVLGAFAAIAMVASFATAIYGTFVPEMRTHYAHSLSVMVVFAVYQHIFYTGALSMNWPSVLVAFWSNYAWAGGMIYSEEMQNSINDFIGSNKGNLSMVGAAGSGETNDQVGGGYDLHKLYGRSLGNSGLNIGGLIKRSKYNKVARSLEHTLAKRTLTNSSDGFDWYGHPVKPGLPLPGNYSGFAGTLGQEEIPVSNAFMTGFLWFLILIACVAAAVVAFKWLVEGLILVKLVKKDRLPYFRQHWLGYAGLAVLRTLFIGFFMMMFLTLFQFTFDGAAGVVAVAAIVFIILFVGMFGIAVYASIYRIKVGNYESKPDRLYIERQKALGFIPWYGFSRAGSAGDDEKVFVASIPFWRISPVNGENAKSIHEDEDYVTKFGWLSARFRRTRWWFFSAWLAYEFIRACFYAGASGHPMTQVFGLLVVEFLAFVAIVILRPFEGQRLNAIVVYCLGFSKVASVALSAAFDVHFNLARITTTVIGVVIIVIQGILTCILLLAVVVGAFSAHMSVTRHRSREQYRPRRLRWARDRWFKHLERVEKDVPRPPPEPVVPEEPKHGFNVASVRRVAKIEDEDEEFQAEIMGQYHPSRMSMASPDVPSPPESSAAGQVNNARRSRASLRSGVSYSTPPFGARVHRASWSSRDFQEHFVERESQRMVSTDNLRDSAGPSDSREHVARSPSPMALNGHSTPPDRTASPQRGLRDSYTASPAGASRPPLVPVISESASEEEAEIVAKPKETVTVETKDVTSAATSPAEDRADPPSAPAPSTLPSTMTSTA